MPRACTSGCGQGMALRQRRELVGAARGCATRGRLIHPGREATVPSYRTLRPLRRRAPDVATGSTRALTKDLHSAMLLRVLLLVVVAALALSWHWFRRATRCTCVAEPVGLRALAVVSSRIRESHGER